MYPGDFFDQVHLAKQIAAVGRDGAGDLPVSQHRRKTQAIQTGDLLLGRNLFPKQQVAPLRTQRDLPRLDVGLARHHNALGDLAAGQLHDKLRRAPAGKLDPARVDAFGKHLRDAYFHVTVRYSKGDDIGAACGQLDGALAA